jgi:hypothetical protein
MSLPISRRDETERDSCERETRAWPSTTPRTRRGVAPTASHGQLALSARDELTHDAVVAERGQAHRDDAKGGKQHHLQTRNSALATSAAAARCHSAMVGSTILSARRTRDGGLVVAARPHDIVCHGLLRKDADRLADRRRIHVIVSPARPVFDRRCVRSRRHESAKPFRIGSRPPTTVRPPPC